MTQEQYEKLKNIDTKELHLELVNKLRGQCASEDFFLKAITICYNTYLENNDDNWDLDILLAYILFNNESELQRKGSSFSTPASISTLCNNLLQTTKDDSFIELCSGNGCFFVENAFSIGNYTGVEINENSNAIAKIRSQVLGRANTLLVDNALTFSATEKADKAFGNFPFAIRKGLEDYKDTLFETIGIPTDINATSDWFFSSALLGAIKQTGRAVAVVTNGTTMNLLDKDIRKEYIEKGYLETVISLPRNLFSDTGIPVNVLVFTYGNKNVNLVDASELYVKGRRINTLSADHIKKIISLLGVESEISTVKTCDELRQNDWVISPIRYLAAPVIENGVPLGDYIKNVTRGVTITAKDLETIRSETETCYRYINLSSIKDGILDYTNKVEWLKEIPVNHKKYCVKNNTILLSKIGSPSFKSAIVQKDDDFMLLPASNFFVIEIDETKVIPAYIQAFFASALGLKALQSISAGTSFYTFSVENLKRLLIPLATKEMQERIAQDYINGVDKLIVLEKNKLETMETLKNLFD